MPGDRKSPTPEELAGWRMFANEATSVDLQTRLDEALAACAAMREALEHVQSSHAGLYHHDECLCHACEIQVCEHDTDKECDKFLDECSCCLNDGVVRSALSADAGRDELERRRRAENRVAELESDLQPVDEVAHDGWVQQALLRLMETIRACDRSTDDRGYCSCARVVGEWLVARQRKVNGLARRVMRIEARAKVAEHNLTLANGPDTGEHGAGGTVAYNAARRK